MVFIESIDDKFLLISFQNEIRIYDLLQNCSLFYNLKHTHQITVSKYLPIKNLLIYSDLTKSIYIDDLNSKTNIAKKILSKRGVKLLSTNDESKLLVADKSGDVYIIDLNNLQNTDFTLLMGHISSLLDVVLDFNQKFLYTADRDEKIRCSHFPNSYNIESYLLGHEEFIRQIEFVQEDILLSASGDGWLFLWNPKVKDPIQKIDLKELSNGNQNGVYRFSYNSTTGDLLVNLYKTNFLLHFKYNKSLTKLEFQEKIFQLNSTIHEFIHLKNNFYLFIQPVNRENKDLISIKTLNNDNQLQDIDETNEFMKVISDVKSLDNLKQNLDNEIKETNMIYSSFYKNKVDNMGEYLTRKEKRMNNKKRKISETNSTSSNSNN